ncbi:uncharacterized protein VTP21DRAFT_5919 [Calcarisporiella thermophila]|uniref:uncharacterized protein n=1 Tax=Calcarisporiella thermophila TaxID=911321 RepID=UPI003743CA17
MNIGAAIIAKMPYYRLKDLIKAIRACKTAADERKVIQKESALIRTSFKEENNDARYSNVAKLLYIHMLGYPAHFGQIECLKLVASNRYADKRLGYLGIMLLLDENQEVLTLVTNSLKNDMNHSNAFIVGLALCTLGNISSPEMARDLCAEVEKLLGSTNPYIRKKAALCAVRIIRRVPDLQENFLSKAKQLLGDRNHGVLLTGVTLAIELCEINPENLSAFRKGVPLLVRNLKDLTTAGFSQEHDVTGVTDPFLQVKLLRLLRVLGRGDVEASEAMNDILAQVATNTETAKNVGNAILYETVLTILDIRSESGLKVLAINILGKFLSNRDNNIRYVALETLNKTISIDPNAVQRHRKTILECLRDGDISIRRRALELSFALINESNVRVLTRELLSFLEIADTEFKPSMTTKICLAAERFAPNKRWHIDTVMRVLKLAGNYVREEVLAGFIRLVAQSNELQAYSARKMYFALKSDISQESLVLAGAWIIGEYGDLLISGAGAEDDEPVKEISEADVIQLLESILAGPYINQTTRQYVITALMKLSARFTNTASISQIQSTIQRFSSSIEIEIQQRSTEYGNLFNYDSIRPAVLERMPVPEAKATRIADTLTGENEQRNAAEPSDQDLLLDLMGVGTASSTAPVAAANSTQSTQKQSANNLDLLADIFGGANISSAPSTAPPASASQGNDILDLLGGSGATSAQKPAGQAPARTSPSVGSPPTQPPSAGRDFQAYSKNGLKITFTPSRDQTNPNIINIMVTFINEGLEAMSDILFQAAVPKSQKLQMQPPSATTLTPGMQATQAMRIANPARAAVRIRLRILYTLPSGRVEDMAEFGGFPEGSY